MRRSQLCCAGPACAAWWTSAPRPVAAAARMSPGLSFNAGSPRMASSTAGTSVWAVGERLATDTALRARPCAGYAAHMRSPEFRCAIDELLDEATATRTAIMCAESVWWRCHRRMVADFVVLARGMSVLHLMHDGRLQEHIPSDLARVREDGLLVYDAGQPPLWIGRRGVGQRHPPGGKSGRLIKAAATPR